MEANKMENLMRLLWAITMVCSLLFTPAAGAQETVLLLTGEWDPYVSETVDNYGFAAEVVSYAFIAAGFEPRFEFATWNRCEAQIKSGAVLATFPHELTEEREKFAIFSSPIAMSSSFFFYMKERLENFSFTSLENLQDYTIGGVKGYYYVPMFQRAGLNVDYASSATFSFKKLYLGMIDVLPENEFVGWKIINKLYPNELYKFGTSTKALNESSLHLMVSRRFPGSAAVLQKFNQGLESIMQKGIYRKILKKYVKNTKIDMPHTIY